MPYSEKKTDKHGYEYTLYGVFDICKDRLEKRFGRKVSYRTFSKVVHAYFDFVLRYVVDTCLAFRLPNRMGEMMAVKTMCTRYNPVRTVYYQENGEVKKGYADMWNKGAGYAYFVFWFCSKKLRMFRFTADKKYRKAMMESVKGGGDYIDISEFHGHIKKSGNFSASKRIRERKRWRKLKKEKALA